MADKLKGKKGRALARITRRIARVIGSGVYTRRVTEELAQFRQLLDPAARPGADDRDRVRACVAARGFLLDLLPSGSKPLDRHLLQLVYNVQVLLGIKVRPRRAG